MEIKWNHKKCSVNPKADKKGKERKQTKIRWNKYKFKITKKLTNFNLTISVII